MFTGLVQDKGIVEKLKANETGMEIYVSSKISKSLVKGESVCTNGVCLSVAGFFEKGYTVYAVKETLSKTNLGELKIGDAINLELALSASDKMGGHYVTGHADDCAQVIELKKLEDDSAELWIEMPESLIKYCIAQGSLAVNGVSLTIAQIEGNRLKIALIPITLEDTNLGNCIQGTQLNVEVDMMAKYLEKFVSPYLAKLSGESDVK